MLVDPPSDEPTDHIEARSVDRAIVDDQPPTPDDCCPDDRSPYDSTPHDSPASADHRGTDACRRPFHLKLHAD